MKRLFLAPDASVAVEVEDQALDAMLVLCRNSGKLETGGILIGRYGEYRDRVIVSRLTGPPRDSRQLPANFIRGITGLARRLRGPPVLRRRVALPPLQLAPAESDGPGPDQGVRLRPVALVPAAPAPHRRRQPMGAPSSLGRAIRPWGHYGTLRCRAMAPRRSAVSGILSDAEAVQPASL